MNDAVFEFYEALTDDYHLLFADWKEAVLRQGTALDRFIRIHMGERPLSVLDCSCGIGTQAIGLAIQGYKVHATDLTPSAVARAEREAREFGVSLTWGVADVRRLRTQVAGTFDIVLSCDNALPHLLTDKDLMLAAQNMWSKARPGGLLLVSIRDYDRIAQKKPRFMPTNIVDGPEGRRIVFQLWDWHDDGRTYTLHHFLVRQQGAEWTTTHRVTEYRALSRHDLSEILQEAGFSEISWHSTEESGYVQPIVTARRWD